MAELHAHDCPAKPDLPDSMLTLVWDGPGSPHYRRKPRTSRMTDRWAEICGWCGQLAGAGRCDHDNPDADPAREGMYDTMESEAAARVEDHELRSGYLTSAEYGALSAEERWSRHTDAVGADTSEPRQPRDDWYRRSELPSETVSGEAAAGSLLRGLPGPPL